MQRVKRLFNLIRGYFPSHLPTGTQDFELFADSIFSTYNLPNLPSYRHAIATMIMHLPPQTYTVPKRYFVSTIKKAMANEIAYQKIQDYKKSEEEKEKALDARDRIESPAENLV